MTMEYSGSDNPSGEAQGLRRSVGEATERIHEIIDAAERVASEIRQDAEAEANRYLEERRREADRASEDRNAALDQLTKTLADTAEEFKQRAERMLAELDRAIVDARAGVYRRGASSAVGEPSAPEPLEPLGERRDPLGEPPAPLRERDRLDPPPLAPPTGDGLDFGPSPSKLPTDDPFELPPLQHEPVAAMPDPQPRESERPAATVSAYPGRGDAWREERPAADADATSEALLRATQLAVTGKDRSEIAAALRADFPGVDTEPLLDEILG